MGLSMDEDSMSDDARHGFAANRFIPFFQNHWHDVYVPESLLDNWRVKVRKLNFYTGRLEPMKKGDELYLIPMEREEVSKQMDACKPHKCRDDFGDPRDTERNIHLGELTSHDSAVILNYLSVMLEHNVNGGMPGALDTTTHWRRGM